MTSFNSTEEPGTVAWITDEPLWIGPSDEVSYWFDALCAAGSAGNSMYETEVAAIAKWAWDVQSETIHWLYTEDNRDPASWGLPDAQEYLTKHYELGQEVATRWAYESLDDERKELYWMEKENERLGEEIKRKRASL